MATRVGRAHAQPHTRAETDTGEPRGSFTGARADQRTRLLDAVVETVADQGYPDAKIAEIARRAGVSRATFYELFENKQACVLEAQAELGERVGSVIEAAIETAGCRAANVAITELVALAERERSVFDFLTHETMLAGREAQAHRDALIERVTRATERAWAGGTGGQDIPARFLLEGAIRLLSLRMRRDAQDPRPLLVDLLAWADSYATTDGLTHWRVPAPDPALLARPSRRASILPVHASLPKGRHRMAADVVRGVQRERICHATAEAVRAKGYAEVTVADIVSAAGVSRDVFYLQFHDKDEAFDGAAQLLFESLLATMAGAFFGDAGEWPDHLWDAGWAFENFLEAEPSLAHFLFVATYEPPSRIGRVLDFILVFTLFVEGGNQLRAAEAQVSRSVTEAIVCAVLEVVNVRVRNERVEELRGLVPVITYMVFAPFMGPEAARAFVCAKVAAERRAADEPS